MILVLAVNIFIKKFFEPTTNSVISKFWYLLYVLYLIFFCGTFNSYLEKLVISLKNSSGQ